MGDLKNRIARARNIFTKLGKIWKNNKITKKTITRLFKTLVTPVLLYGCADIHLHFWYTRTGACKFT